MTCSAAWRTRLVSVLGLAMLFQSTIATGAPPREAAIEADPAVVAVYLPPAELASRAYLASLNAWVEPGLALSNAVDGIGRRYFPNLVLVPTATDRPYTLLLDLHPTWKTERGKVYLTLRYRVLDAQGKQLADGTQEEVAPVRGMKFNAAVENAALQGLQRVMARTQGILARDSAHLQPGAGTATIDFGTLVDRDKPLRTGTAFYINASGDLLTAAHVSRDCVVLEAHDGQDVFNVVETGSSTLLDVAVLASGRQREKPLTMREGQALMLGEPLTSVGYPLQGVLGDSAQVTRGNVSSSKGLRGSMGMFQFSAPIQPGNSGGPVVSDHGELLGMTVGTLNAARMADLGHIPQNVNFALEARHIVRFLEKAGVAFGTSPVQEGAGTLMQANQAALSNAVQLNCYQ